MDQKPLSRKVTSGTVGGAGSGALFAWVWGMVMPEQPMPPEIAAIIGPMIGGVIGYFVKDAPL